jgi:hypothetical protein
MNASPSATARLSLMLSMLGNRIRAIDPVGYAKHERVGMNQSAGFKGLALLTQCVIDDVL